MHLVRRFIRDATVATLRAISRWSAAGLARFDPAARRQIPPVGGRDEVLPHLTRALSGKVPGAAIGDLEARQAVGVETYGAPLRAWSVGRDPLVDLAQELYDGPMYATQALLEDADLVAIGERPRLPRHVDVLLRVHLVSSARLARLVLDAANDAPRAHALAALSRFRDRPALSEPPDAQAGQ